VNGHAIHVNVAQLVRQAPQRIHLIRQLHLTHPTTDVTFESLASMPRSSRVDADDTISLRGQHMHPQLMFSLRKYRITSKLDKELCIL